jgi:shikimate 5-dehydrogenase
VLLRRQQRSNNIGFRQGFDQLHQNLKGELKMATNSSIALITGGTSGIGRAAANKLAQLGIHVLFVGRNAERGEKTVAEIRTAGGKRTLFRLTCQSVERAKWRKRSNSEMAMSIF